MTGNDQWRGHRMLTEAEWEAKQGPKPRPLGCALAMRVMQSDLFQQLDDAERADCDELVRRNVEWFKADSTHAVKGGA